jgi:Flp pilus assembly protein TadG
LFKLHKRGRRREGGQTLILVTLALPLFLALVSLVIDGGNILVHKRNIQVAADAAALAMAQEIGLSSTVCTPACQDQGRIYAKNNGVDVDSSWHQCDATHTTNCWTYPYNGQNDLVEVRLRAHVTTFIAGMIGIYGADVSARAVSGVGPTTTTNTTPDVTSPSTTLTIPGGTHTTTGPDQLSGGSGIAFTMSRVCDSIVYTGAGSKGDDVLGALATNGGLSFGGLGQGSAKKVTWLAFDQARCGPAGSPASPPSGTSQCTAVAWGDPTNSKNACVKTLAPLHNPINWPITPPTPPTPTALAGNTPYPPDWYPSKCIDIGNPGTNGQFGDPKTTLIDHGPGVYCVRGAGTLHLDNLSQAAGDGYTFYALNDNTLNAATISIGGNGSTLKFYWPSACGPNTRPTGYASSYPCPGLNKTITGYDAFALLYSDFPSANGTTCAICLSGGSNNLTGDMFATKPDLPFPPSLTQTGGLISVAGGALAAGRGFIESWNLNIGGNTGSYQGTGASIVIPGQTQTTTDPDTVTTSPGTVISGTVQTITVGTDFNLHE